MTCYDPIRQKSVASTPEEAVRQQVICFLKESLGVPPHLMEIEFSLSKIKKASKDRVDILVHDFRRGADISKPWLLVECKAEGQYTWQELEIQLNRYLKVLKPSFIMLGLGVEVRFFAFSEMKNTFLPISELPKYPK
ncbi:MAG TPA: type I restriction enzyme HsdR N-terminal domain-containing protein [Fibrobacteraceae bacterium]|jgi:hypothetical protein|nr:type I restriction enzyme HsdR N-terminal domain-containing protein [Fibrobacteraceae bacterium]HQB65768.1 type I restriction enzyme HsdR N-terminal domain-containing protein [Fibrobacteraceae bacterium]